MTNNIIVKIKVNVYLPWYLIIGSASSIDIPVTFAISSMFLPSLAILIANVILDSSFNESASLDISWLCLSSIYLKSSKTLFCSEKDTSNDLKASIRSFNAFSDVSIFF